MTSRYQDITTQPAIILHYHWCPSNPLTFVVHHYDCTISSSSVRPLALAWRLAAKSASGSTSCIIRYLRSRSVPSSPSRNALLGSADPAPAVAVVMEAKCWAWSTTSGSRERKVWEDKYQRLRLVDEGDIYFDENVGHIISRVIVESDNVECVYEVLEIDTLTTA